MIVMNLHWKGVSKSQYDACRDGVQWEKTAPKGALSHVAWFDDTGIHVTDVWENAESFNAFVSDRLMPIAKGKLNIPGEPTVQIHPAHRYFDAVHGTARS
jgi:hypothetical protein